MRCEVRHRFSVRMHFATAASVWCYNDSEDDDDADRLICIKGLWIALYLMEADEWCRL